MLVRSNVLTVPPRKKDYLTKNSNERMKHSPPSCVLSTDTRMTFEVTQRHNGIRSVCDYSAMLHARSDKKQCIDLLCSSLCAVVGCAVWQTLGLENGRASCRTLDLELPLRPARGEYQHKAKPYSLSVKIAGHADAHNLKNDTLGSGTTSELFLVTTYQHVCLPD